MNGRGMLALALGNCSTPEEATSLVTMTLELAKGEALAISRLLDEHSDPDASAAVLLAYGLAGRLEALCSLVGLEMAVAYHAPAAGVGS